MPTDTINMRTALLQLLQSWQRAGLQDLMRPQDSAVRQMLQTLQTEGTATAAESAPGHPIANSSAVSPLPPKNSPGMPTATHNPRTLPPVPATRATQIGAGEKMPTTTTAAAADMTPAGQAAMSAAKPVIPGEKTAKTLFTTISPQELAKNEQAFAAPLAEALPAAARPAQLEIIAREVAACTRCPELASTRTQTVFHDGSCTAELCLVGEAPGADEDETGVPFVGRAGQLLTKIIEACQLRRDQVYICNVLKCRPPGNRPPESGEVANCRGYLEQQIEIVRPQVIVCLGTTAAQSLLNSQISIGKLRKKWHDYRGIPLYCTYHPSYLLRNPAAKKDVWEDMKVVMSRLGVEL